MLVCVCACVCLCSVGVGCDEKKEDGREKNDRNENDEDGSADIIDMNRTCISLANVNRFSYSAVIRFFNIAHNDTLWQVCKLQHRSP